MAAVELAQIDELSDIPLSVEVPGLDYNLLLVKLGDHVYAVQDECSHGHVKLSEGDVDEWECSIECYLHGANFSLKTGEALNLPATQPIAAYPCTIQGSAVLVDIDHPTTTEEN